MHIILAIIFILFFLIYLGTCAYETETSIEQSKYDIEDMKRIGRGRFPYYWHTLSWESFEGIAGSVKHGVRAITIQETDDTYTALAICGGVLYTSNAINLDDAMVGLSNRLKIAMKRIE